MRRFQWLILAALLAAVLSMVVGAGPASADQTCGAPPGSPKHSG